MNRRSFLGILALLFSSKALPASGRERTLRLNRCCVAGLQYYPGVNLRLKNGQMLRMMREPDNPYDANTIALYIKGIKLGYVPKKENTTLALLLDQNAVLRAKVERFDAEARSWERVRIVVGKVG